MSRRRLLIVTVVALVSSAAHAGVLFVDDDAAPGGDGLDWNTAYRFLQDALATAVAGTEIRVAQGAYLPDRNEMQPSGTGIRNIRFTLSNGVMIRGGFAGLGAPDPDARDIALYETILSGDLLGDDGPNFEGNSDNSYHVVFGTGTDLTAVLDGFTITSGNADGSGSNFAGGGVQILNGGGTIAHCRFVGNRAEEVGGGLDVVAGSVGGDLVLLECVFLGNSSGNAGGGGRIQNVPAVVDGCVFQGNVAGGSGGGLFTFTGNASLLITGCSFVGNSAATGGGIRLSVASTGEAIVSGSSFSANQAGMGGGVSSSGDGSLVACTLSNNSADFGGGLYVSHGNLSLDGCSFVGNAADQEGGGAYVCEGDPIFVNCTIRENIALLNGGGIYNAGVGTTLQASDVSDNTAAFGGGIYVFLGGGTYFNCTFGSNTANEGGGGFNFAADPIFTDCTFVLNSATGPGGGVLNFAGDPAFIQCAFTANDAEQGGGFYSVGGDPRHEACSFNANIAVDGGGAYNVGSDPTLDDCLFANNFAHKGGGMYILSANPIVTGCAFEGNVVAPIDDFGWGGGMYTVNSDPVIRGCIFRNNFSNLVGGGMYSTDSNSKIVESMFVGNSIGAGGGMYHIGGTLEVVSCTFTSNHSNWAGGGIYVTGSPDTTVANCTFNGNTANHPNLDVLGRGGGLYNASATLVANCTFAANIASAEGGGVYNSDLESSLVVRNCILWANHPEQIANSVQSPLTVEFCDVEDGFVGAGNITADPLFVDADGPDGISGTEDDDLRLSPGSPSIDAGLNNAIADLTDIDLDGNPRFADDPDTDDTGCGVPVVVDMGAYEYQGEPFSVRLGDIDGNGSVGIVDFLMLLGTWGACIEDCCLADLDLDGEVGDTDFQMLLDNWSL